MAKNFYTNIDLKQNQLQNAVIHALAVAPTSPVVGQMYFDTATSQLMVYKLICGDPTATPSTAEYAWRVVDGVVWKDNWAANTAYAVGDIVRAGTAPNVGLYLCITAHKSGTTIDTGNFEALGGGAGSVKDVQIDGTSVIDASDNKAKIVLKAEDLNYNTTDKKLEVVNRTLRETTLDSGATSLVSNNKGDEGAVMKITKGTDFAAAVAVNDNKDLGAQIYNVDPSQGNKGTRINVGQEKIYYTKGQTSPAVTDDDEIATMGEVNKKVNRSTTTTSGATSLVSNDPGDEGAVLKITNTAGMSAVAVNSFTDGDGIGAQIYDVKGTTADDDATLIDVTQKGAYYYTGKFKGAADRKGTEETTTAGDKFYTNEIATRGTSQITIEKTTTGLDPKVAAKYTIKQNGKAVDNGEINIPQDWLLKGAYTADTQAFSDTKAYTVGELVIQTAGTKSDIYAVKTAGTYADWAAFTAAAVKTANQDIEGVKYLVLYMNVDGSTTIADQLVLIKLKDVVSVVPEVKSVTGTLAADATSVDVTVPAETGKTIKYMFTKTAIDGEECVTDVKWDSTNSKVTVSVAKVVGAAIAIEVFYSVI